MDEMACGQGEGPGRRGISRMRISQARLESLRVQNYRVLRDVHFANLQPLTVLLGANGSGKSTLFDVFAFLSECYSLGVRSAWEKRNRFAQLRSRGADGPIRIEIRYREAARGRVLTYTLAIDEEANVPAVVEERLRWTRGSAGRPADILHVRRGEGDVVPGDAPDEATTRETFRLDAPDLLAVNALGQFQNHPRVSALRRFILGWHVSYLSTQSGRASVEPGPQPHLSSSGDNLPNVVQFLLENDPKRLEDIFKRLARRIPQLERVEPERMTDGRLLLQLKDRPFAEPILAKFASDGTLKLLAYLLLLHDPQPPPFIGIEEPENFLYPRLLRDLIEECGIASAHSQLFVTTHSPELLDALDPVQVFLLRRADNGYAQATRLSEIPGLKDFLEAGALLGDLWMQGQFSPPRQGGARALPDEGAQ